MTRKPTAAVFGGTEAAPQHAALKALVGMADNPAGSRRRSLWELGTHAHCPVMGVCLPLEQLKRLMHKVGLEPKGRSDYELHLIAVNECRRRTPLAEAVQRTLEQRFDLALRALRPIKCSEALQDHWEAAAQQPDWAGALWAVLTHPCCTTVLEHEVLGQVHMLQHQVGMVTRVDNQHWVAARQVLGAAQAEVLELQGRLQAQTRQWTQRLEAQTQELQQQRQGWLAEQAQHERTQAELDTVRRSVHGLDERLQLQADNARLRQQVAELERTLRRRGELLPEVVPKTVPSRSDDSAVLPRPVTDCSVLCGADCRDQGGGAPGLRQRKVVCVGGRAAQVPAYREAVETRGAHFLYHDGGEEDSLNRLPGTLAAADLVICQVGCISHNAYWRVKEHCKRTGTPCAFVDSPSKSAMERALRAMEADQPVV